MKFIVIEELLCFQTPLSRLIISIGTLPLEKGKKYCLQMIFIGTEGLLEVLIHWISIPSTRTTLSFEPLPLKRGRNFVSKWYPSGQRDCIGFQLHRPEQLALSRILLLGKRKKFKLYFFSPQRGEKFRWMLFIGTEGSLELLIPWISTPSSRLIISIGTLPFGKGEENLSRFFSPRKKLVLVHGPFEKWQNFI